MKSLSIYCHIPFCSHKCAYCHFNTTSYRESSVDDYLVALEMHLDWFISQYEGGYQLKSVFFGGGTPSLIPGNKYQPILKKIKDLFEVKDLEITLEANPETVNTQSLNEYLQVGFNRISFGGQSFDSHELKTLDRIHSAEKIIKSVSLASDVGFHRISLDLIYGIPHQSLRRWEDNLIQALQLPINHISCYELTLDHGTQLGYQLKKGMIHKPKDEVVSDMYRTTQSVLRKNKFKQYEISSYAHEGQHCQHNRAYWENNEYWGVGSGAFSYWKGQRFCFSPYSMEFARKKHFLTQEFYQYELLDQKTQQAEDLVLGLRLIEGVSLKKLKDKHGFDLTHEQYEEMDHLIDMEILYKKYDRISLTDKGLLFADKVAVDLMPGENT